MTNEIIIETSHIVSSLVSILLPTFGPQGLDVLIQSTTGTIIVTNNGEHILNSIEIHHPIGRYIIRALLDFSTTSGDSCIISLLLINQLLISLRREHICSQRAERIRYLSWFHEMKSTLLPLEIFPQLLSSSIETPIEKSTFEDLRKRIFYLLKTSLSNKFCETTSCFLVDFIHMMILSTFQYSYQKELHPVLPPSSSPDCFCSHYQHPIDSACKHCQHIATIPRVFSQLFSSSLRHLVDTCEERCFCFSGPKLKHTMYDSHHMVLSDVDTKQFDGSRILTNSQHTFCILKNISFLNVATHPSHMPLEFDTKGNPCIYSDMVSSSDKRNRAFFNALTGHHKVTLILVSDNLDNPENTFFLKYLEEFRLSCIYNVSLSSLTYVADHCKLIPISWNHSFDSQSSFASLQIESVYTLRENRTHLLVASFPTAHSLPPLYLLQSPSLGQLSEFFAVIKRSLSLLSRSLQMESLHLHCVAGGGATEFLLHTLFKNIHVRRDKETPLFSMISEAFLEIPSQLFHKTTSSHVFRDIAPSFFYHLSKASAFLKEGGTGFNLHGYIHREMEGGLDFAFPATEGIIEPLQLKYDVLVFLCDFFIHILRIDKIM